MAGEAPIQLTGRDGRDGRDSAGLPLLSDTVESVTSVTSATNIPASPLAGRVRVVVQPQGGDIYLSLAGDGTASTSGSLKVTDGAIVNLRTPDGAETEISVIAASGTVSVYTAECLG